jgi:solute carrier family 45 protein 1/2/4
MEERPAHPKVVKFRRDSSTNAPLNEYINEHSPLVRPRASTEVDPLLKVVSPIESEEEEDWLGDPDADAESKSSWYLFLLTLGGLGLQIGWSVETSNGSVSPSTTEVRIVLKTAR